MADHRTPLSRLVSLLAGVAVVGAFPLLLLEYTDAGTYLLIGGLIVSVLSRGNPRKQARLERARRFEEWAQTRGLVLGPSPVAAPHHLFLLRKSGMRVERAATRTMPEGRVTVMDWSWVTTDSDGTGRTVPLTGVVVPGTTTESHLLLQPARWKQLPTALSGQRRWTSGHTGLDDAFTILTEDEHDPGWLDERVATALARFAGPDTQIEVADDVIVVTRSRVDPDAWDGLLADGEELARALAGRSFDR
jgi:hypothetical protein